MSESVVRGLRPDEAMAFVRSVRIPFLDPATGGPEEQPAMDRWAGRVEADRAWVAEDAGRFVANAAVYSMDVSVSAGPDGVCPVLAMGGVAAVGVHPTHRRRGLLRQLMGRMLEDARRRGQPPAGLHASESVIYGRFGFGPATEGAALRIDKRRGAMVDPAPVPALQILDRDEATKVIAGLFDRLRPLRAGEVSMTPVQMGGALRG